MKKKEEEKKEKEEVKEKKKKKEKEEEEKKKKKKKKVISPHERRPERKAGHSTPSSTEIENAWSCVPPLFHMRPHGVVFGHTDSFKKQQCDAVCRCSTDVRSSGCSY